MQPLDYYVAASVDGFIARETGAFDFLLTEGPHVADYLAALTTFDAVLMGRRTYEVGTRVGVRDPYPMLRTFVVSRSLAEPTPDNITLVRDDVPGFVGALKQRGGRGIYLCGGCEVATQLLAERLVDYVTVKINPVLVGAGIPLVGALPAAVELALADHKIYDNGVVVLRYGVRYT